MRAVIEAAIPLSVDRATVDESSLVSALVASDCDRTTAARLVEFMPLARFLVE